MPFKNTLPILEKNCFKVDYKMNSRYSVLSNDSLLYLSYNWEKKETTVKIFSVDDLESAQIECLFPNRYELLCTFKNNTFLLKTGRPFIEAEIKSNKELLHICSHTLATLSSSITGQEYIGEACVVADNCFFIYQQKILSNRSPTNYEMTFYQQQDSVFIKSHVLALELQSQKNGAVAESIIKLKNNRYGCRVLGLNTNEFNIVVFDIDKQKQTVTKIGMITPNAQHKGTLSSLASGNINVLPHGKLITYHSCNDHVQLWDTKSLHCISEWYWEKIVPKDESFPLSHISIRPLADSGNILVYQTEKLFIFNLYRLSMKRITLHVNPSCVIPTLVLSNGDVLLFIDPKENEQYNLITQLTLKEVSEYFGLMGEHNLSKQNAYQFFKNQLPREISEHIMSFAYTSETYAEASKHASETAVEEKDDLNEIKSSRVTTPHC